MANPITFAVTMIVLSEPAQDGRPVMQRAPIGRAAVRDSTGPTGPFVSSTLSSTGHKTHFKRYSEAQQPDGQSGMTGYGGYGTTTGIGMGGTSGAISPYLNFARGGSTLNNYLSFQRDTQIYNTGAQTQQISNQLRQATSLPVRAPTQPFIQNIDTAPTPLQRRFQAPEGGAASGEQTAILREILRELKGLREDTTNARPERAPQVQPQDKPQDQ
jgi:hypothetical protein